MNYETFREIFDYQVVQKSKSDLLVRLCEKYHLLSSSIYRGKLKIEILQNLLQSHEIRFGDAFEKVMERYFKLMGCELLPKKFKIDAGDLNIDQCFRYKDKVYFIEQKVRDDHDSSKKRGQILNFEKKLDLMQSYFGAANLVGVFYFIDPDLVKNRNFYTEELQKISDDYKVETQIFYGKPLFDYLGMTEVWDEILNYLEVWKKEIPDLPEINFDLDAADTFEEIKDLKPLVFRKLLSNDEIFEQIILTLFPEKTTLRLLQSYFEGKGTAIYDTLATKLNARL